MLDRRDPELKQDREIAILLHEQNWRDGLIGDHTLMRSLMLLGASDRDARWRLSFLIMERSRELMERRTKWERK